MFVAKVTEYWFGESIGTLLLGQLWSLWSLLTWLTEGNLFYSVRHIYNCYIPDTLIWVMWQSRVHPAMSSGGENWDTENCLYSKLLIKAFVTNILLFVLFLFSSHLFRQTSSCQQQGERRLSLAWHCHFVLFQNNPVWSVTHKKWSAESLFQVDYLAVKCDDTRHRRSFSRLHAAQWDKWKRTTYNFVMPRVNAVTRA